MARPYPLVECFKLMPDAAVAVLGDAVAAVPDLSACANEKTKVKLHEQMVAREDQPGEIAFLEHEAGVLKRSGVALASDASVKACVLYYNEQQENRLKNGFFKGFEHTKPEKRLREVGKFSPPPPPPTGHRRDQLRETGDPGVGTPKPGARAASARVRGSSGDFLQKCCAGPPHTNSRGGLAARPKNAPSHHSQVHLPGWDRRGVGWRQEQGALHGHLVLARAWMNG